jgi:hypothetical protein
LDFLEFPKALFKSPLRIPFGNRTLKEGLERLKT